MEIALIFYLIAVPAWKFWADGSFITAAPTDVSVVQLTLANEAEPRIYWSIHLLRNHLSITLSYLSSCFYECTITKMDLQTVVVVMVHGPSCSGKTTLVAKIKEQLSRDVNCSSLHQVRCLSLHCCFGFIVENFCQPFTFLRISQLCRSFLCLLFNPNCTLSFCIVTFTGWLLPSRSWLHSTNYYRGRKLLQLGHLGGNRHPASCVYIQSTGVLFLFWFILYFLCKEEPLHSYSIFSGCDLCNVIEFNLRIRVFFVFFLP